jgi:putative transposase
MTEEEKQAIALFKYSLIAPLVAGSFMEASKAEYYRVTSGKEYTYPNGEKTRYTAGTLKKWYMDYMKQGLDALKPLTRSDLGRSRKLPAGAIDKIYEYRLQMPYITVKKIYSKLIEEGYLNKKDSSIDSVYRYMRSNSELKNSIPVKECLSFEFEHAGDCWQADSSHGPTITVGRKKVTTWLISFQDDASRMIVHGEFFENDNANNVQLCFKKAIGKAGKPKRIYLDNGSSYANQQLDLICAELGIHLIHTKPYHPTSHGKIERSHRTMKDGWMNANDWNQWSSLKELNDSYQNFLATKYTNEMHSSLGMSPKERYLKDMNQIKFVEKEQLEAAFLNRTTRKVTATATVSIFNTEYEVPQEFIRKKIELRYDPFNTARLYVYQDGKQVSEAIPVKKVENTQRKRQTNICYAKMDGGSGHV